jgi:signal transduction histidine kinase
VAIPAEDLPHVFEACCMTARGGSGIGFAMARQAVEALGGGIRVDSREGEGVRVEIELPVDALSERAPRKSTGTGGALFEGLEEMR